MLGLTACNNSTIEDNNKTVSAAADSVIADPQSDNEINTDTIVYDNFTFPTDSLFSTKVLCTGNFHSDEVWNNADKQNWFGLFHNNEGCYLAETELKIKRVHDEGVDENANKKTGWEIKTANKDTSILLIERSASLTANKIEPVVLKQQQIMPGDTLRINYAGVDYKLFASGGKKKSNNNPDMFDVWNYKLYISATVKDTPRKSLLVAQPNFDDRMITILFAGDIDGDGVLDLIIDTSRHYNVSSIIIYLSKPAENSELLKPMGGHISAGC